MKLELEPIAIVHSPYKQKFAIPRQPNLVPEAVGEVRFEKEFRDPNMLRELNQFSHLWLIFVFHQTMLNGWSPTVQPPRLGGKKRVGVFASRSPFRPNPLGLSVVKNLGIANSQGEAVLRIGGLDLVDGTPVVDIKPYLPYADAIPTANEGFTTANSGRLREVRFSESAQAALLTSLGEYPELEAFIESVLIQDPRPAWRVSEQDDKRYGMTLYDLNIKWIVDDTCVEVISISKCMT